MTANARDISRALGVRDSAATPPELFQVFETMAGGFDLDVCADSENTKCVDYISIGWGAFNESWKTRNWCNPPYSRGQTIRWIKKATAEAHNRDATTYLLLRGDFSTAWFAELARVATDILLLTPRINFIPPPGIKYSGNGFASILGIIRPGGDPGGGATIKTFNWKDAASC